MKTASHPSSDASFSAGPRLAAAPPFQGTVRRLLILRLSFIPLFAFFFWALSAPHALNTDVWAWTAHAVAPVPGLVYAALAAIGLFAALSFVAYFLHVSPASADRPSWQFGLTFILLPALALRVIPFYCWVMPAQLASARHLVLGCDAVVLAALAAGLLLQQRSLWWMSLYAWNPLTLYALADARRDFAALAALAAVLLTLEVWWHRLMAPRNPATCVSDTAARGPLFRRPAVVRAATLVVAGGASLTLFLTPFSGPWPDPARSNSLPAHLLSRLMHSTPPSSIIAELCGLYALLLAVVLLLAVLRRWPPAKTLGHALMVAVLLTPNPQAQDILWPLLVLPLAWNAATWTLALTILPLYVAPRFAPAPLPDYLLLIIWLPPLVLGVRQLVRDSIPGRLLPSNVHAAVA